MTADLTESTRYLFTLGLTVKSNGTITETVPGMPSMNVGLGPGMKIIGVDNKVWNDERLHAAINADNEHEKTIEFAITWG